MKKALLTSVMLLAFTIAHAQFELGVNGGFTPFIKGSAFSNTANTSYTVKKRSGHDLELVAIYSIKKWRLGATYCPMFISQKYGEAIKTAGQPDQGHTFTYKIGAPLNAGYISVDHSSGLGFCYGGELGYASIADRTSDAGTVYAAKSNGVLVGAHVETTAWFVKKMAISLQLGVRYVNLTNNNSYLCFPINFGYHFRFKS